MAFEKKATLAVFEGEETGPSLRVDLDKGRLPELSFAWMGPDSMRSRRREERAFGQRGGR